MKHIFEIVIMNECYFFPVIVVKLSKLSLFSHKFVCSWVFVGKIRNRVFKTDCVQTRPED